MSMQVPTSFCPWDKVQYNPGYVSLKALSACQMSVKHLTLSPSPIKMNLTTQKVSPTTLEPLKLWDAPPYPKTTLLFYRLPFARNPTTLQKNYLRAKCPSNSSSSLHPQWKWTLPLKVSPTTLSICQVLRCHSTPMTPLLFYQLPFAIWWGWKEWGSMQYGGQKKEHANEELNIIFNSLEINEHFFIPSYLLFCGKNKPKKFEPP